MTPRFARMVEKVTGSPDREELLNADEAIKLLQREHAACMDWRRKKLAQSTREQPRTDFGKGYRTALADLLAWLHERGR